MHKDRGLLYRLCQIIVQWRPNTTDRDPNCTCIITFIKIITCFANGFLGNVHQFGAHCLVVKDDRQGCFEPLRKRLSSAWRRAVSFQNGNDLVKQVSVQER